MITQTYYYYVNFEIEGAKCNFKFYTKMDISCKGQNKKGNQVWHVKKSETPLTSLH